MNQSRVDEIARTVLYEGYLLYPYRASALKNRHRFNFGVVAPRDVAAVSGDRWFVQTECLLRGSDDAAVDVTARFLHLAESTGRAPDLEGWQEAVERELRVDVRAGDVAAPVRREFRFADTDVDGLPGRQQPICAALEIAVEPFAQRLAKLRVTVSNVTQTSGIDSNGSGGERAAALRQSLVSTHVVLHVQPPAEFVSLMDPPEDAAAAAGACRNEGLWPVLVGDETERDAVLASPIILYDYPRIAPESAGDFFDGTEIDEILALRVLTMTDEEKAQARQTDPRGRALVDRAEKLAGGGLLKLHGVVRGLRPAGEGGR